MLCRPVRWPDLPVTHGLGVAPRFGGPNLLDCLTSPNSWASVSKSPGSVAPSPGDPLPVTQSNSGFGSPGSLHS